MSQVVNTNMSSGNAQRYLSMNQHSLTSAMQRLSSGLRINSASDDAAGLAISERFTTQIRGNDQAVRNANDGISITQTAEGDLQSIGKNLQRMRELAVQSANASNTDSDRKAIDGELQSLSQEIDRVAKNSSFNGTNLLDGSFTAKNFQVGSNTSVNDTIQVSSITSARTSNLGSAGTSFSAALNGTATTGALTVGALTLNGQAVGASSVAAGAGQSAASAYSVAVAINSVSSLSGVNAVANVNTVSSAAPTAFTALTATSTFSVNGVTVGAIAAGTTAAGQGSNLAYAINQITTQTGVSAVADSSTGALTLTASDGRDINIGLVGTATNAANAITNKNTLLAQTGLSTGVVGQQATAAVAGTSKAAGAFTTAPVAALGTTIAAGTLTAAGTAVGAVTLANETYAAGATAAASASGSTLTIGTLTAGSTYTIASTTTNVGAITLVATGNSTTDAANFAAQYNALGTTQFTAAANLLTSSVGASTLAITAVRTAAQVNAGLTVAQATVTADAATTTANGAGFVLNAGTLGLQNHGGAAYNGQQISNAIQTALTTAGSTATVSASITTGTITSATAAIVFGMGNTAPDAATAISNRTTLAAQTGLTTAQLGEQAQTALGAANHGTVSLSSTAASGIVYGGSNAALAGFAAAGGTVASSATSAVNSIASINVLTATNATNAINSIDGALATINSARASLGAYQNRFASVVDGLQVTTENLTASRSRITDADFAKESANLSRAQVLQQAGTAMLAQANQSAQGVLALLR